MKKITFAIQVSILIAMFPVYIISELKGNSGKSNVDNFKSAAFEKKSESQLKPALVDMYGHISLIKYNIALTD